MLKRVIPNFGAMIAGNSDAPGLDASPTGGANAQPFVHRFDEGHKVYGVRIGSQSVIDQCLVGIGGAGKLNWSVVGSGPVGSSSARSGGIATRIDNSASKISVERPFVWAGEIKELVFAPSRTYTPALSGGLASAYQGFPLELEFLTDPAELGWFPTKRAPMDLEIDVVPTANKTIYVPVFGRKSLWIDVDVENSGGGGLSTTISGRLISFNQTDANWRARDQELVAITAGSMSKQGDGPFDFLRFDIAWVSGGDQWNLRLRADD